MSRAKEYDRRAIRIGAFNAAADARIQAAEMRKAILADEYRDLMNEARTVLDVDEFAEIFETGTVPPGRPSPPADRVIREGETGPNVSRVSVDDLVRTLRGLFEKVGVKTRDFRRPFIDLDDQVEDEPIDLDFRLDADPKPDPHSWSQLSEEIRDLYRRRALLRSVIAGHESEIETIESSIDAARIARAGRPEVDPDVEAVELNIRRRNLRWAMEEHNARIFGYIARAGADELDKIGESLKTANAAMEIGIRE